MRYIGDWEKMTERMGFWVDLDQAYYTLDNQYIESVWHLLKIIWEKGLIYQDYKVVPYDPRIGQPYPHTKWHRAIVRSKIRQSPSVSN
ncbi:MAG: hypothetical protein Ct9H300mP14_09670 [Gammaproteobacteria bacterium]|nr:MAG: hypothetical protein Ct9H300mP14_09670 [Gammaproteobacteria bacterium]